MSPRDFTTPIYYASYVQISAVPDEVRDPEGMRRLLGAYQADDPVGQIIIR
jgi:hypothetical protein